MDLSAKKEEFEVGSTLHLEVDIECNGLQWTFNGENLPLDFSKIERGLEKKNITVNDTGRYELKQNDKVKFAFLVIVYENYKCKIGSTIHLRVNTVSTETTWTFNGNSVRSPMVYPQNGFVKSRILFSNLGRYECIVGSLVKYAFNVIVHEYHEFERGSKLKLKVDTYHDDMAWTFQGKQLSLNFKMNCKTLKKSTAEFCDTGRYELRKNGDLVYAFDVVVCESKTFEIGSSLHFDEKYTGANTECTFEGKCIELIEKQAEHDDSGIYVFTVKDKCVYSCNVIICDYMQVEIGSCLLLDNILHMRLPSEWSLNGQPVFKKGDKFEKEKAEYTDSGKYEIKIGGIVKYMVDVIVYGEKQVKLGSNINLPIDSNADMNTWTFKGKQLSSGCTQEGYTKENASFGDSGIYQHKVSNEIKHVIKVTVYDYLFKDEFLGIRIPGSFEEQTSDIATHKLKKEKVLGIAVIIAIEEYFDKDLGDLPRMKSHDTENFVQTFQQLKFVVRECKVSKEMQIMEFLKKVSKENLKDYTSFVLFVGSHGGNGFMCCSDFNRNKATGLIHISRLLDLFVDNKHLKNKPKLFLLDFCLQRFDWISEWKNQQKIRENFSPQSYKDVCISYAAFAGAKNRGNTQGSFFTQCLMESFLNYAEIPISDLMCMVNGSIMKKKNTQNPETKEICKSYCT